MKNLEIAKILHEIADILEMKGVPFKPMAYRKAAIAIESLSEDIRDIFKRGELEEIPGVGESIAKKIIEIIKTGKLRYHQKLKASMPVDIGELMGVRDVGPKTIKLLYKKLKVKNLKDLKKAAKQQKIRGIKGLGKTIEENILENIKFKRASGGRMLLSQAIPIAEEIKQKLSSLKEVKKFEITGSYKRKKETIGDLDILMISDKPAKVIDSFCSWSEVKKTIAKGRMKASVVLKDGLRIDLYVLSEEKFGSALNYFIGSREHNIELRKVALKKGYTLSEHGLFSTRTKKRVAGRTEEEIYNKLKMQFIPPELRENRGEIEAALRKRLPKLVEPKDLNGDFHCHTNWSDAKNTIEQMALEAQRLGFKFIAITDHASPLMVTRSRGSSNLDDKRVKKYIKAIDNVQKKVKIKIFKGAEVDIKKDGTLNLKKATLKELDVVLAAVHSALKMPEREMTQRICYALENYPVNILAHPTTRLIGGRAPCHLNIEKIFRVAKSTNTFLEADSYPNRLDLNDINIKAAIEAGCKISLGSDAHSKDQIHFVRTMGIPLARRGWATSKDILNCWSLGKIERALKK